MVLQVKNSPFDEEQVKLLNLLLPNITETQQIWLSGYLTALYGSTEASTAGVAVLERPEIQEEQTVAVKEVAVLFGSQTGNSQGIAENLSQQLKENGFQVTLSSMSDFKPNALKKLDHLLIIVSTQGEGDPPDTAIQFHEFLHSKRAPKLEQLRYSVLSLGDSSYEFFCQTGKEFDSRLEELGAVRLAPRVDCDLDFEDSAAEWFGTVLTALEAKSSQAFQLAHDSGSNASEAQSAYSRSNPFKAEVLENINLNARGSNKETRHLELSLEDSGLVYEPGDSLGIYPENDARLVDALIQEGKWDPQELVPINKQADQRPLRDALLHHYEITVLTKPLLEQASQFTSAENLQNLLKADNREALKGYTAGRDVLDLLREFGPWNMSAAEFVSILRKLPPRLYSIASSLNANPDEVHITVGVVRYESHGRNRNGVCSVQCAERAEPGSTLPVYIHKNPNFKLPENPEVPIIMIGPGTGIAPFRSFLEEREETGAPGKSWLFFGDQHFVTDFLYQTEWQRWLREDVLTKLDVAFSRDTEEKVYVQHRMQEHSRELYQWLEEGASIYVCGDEQHMAKDIHATLQMILEQEGGMSAEMAEAYLTKLQQQKRYQRDVY